MLFSSLSKTRRLLVIFAAFALMLPLLAACAGDGDDEEDATATTSASEVATPPVGVAETVEAEDPDEDEATPDADATADADMDTTPDTDATVDTDADETGTADVDTTPDTDATVETDTTPDTDTTAVTDATADTAAGDSPFGDLADLSAEVPNYTVNFDASFENVPDDQGVLYSAEMQMQLEQSEPDVYHLSLMTSGDEELQVEIWALEDATYLSEDGGTAVELPAGMANEFAPAEALMITPDLAVLENAEEVGEDEVNGRTATEYRVDAEDAAMILVAQGQDVEISNPEGEMRVWVDEELNIILRMTADITFENEDGTEGSIDVEYTVSDIGETEDIEAPASS